MLDFREAKKEIMSLKESVSGSLDLDVVEVREGQLVKFGDDLLIDPEVVVSYVRELSAFEEEFGPLTEAAEKLREVKRLEESFGPIEEMGKQLQELVEQTEQLLESLGERGEPGRDPANVHDDDLFGDLEEEEDEDEGDEEEVDISELTVKELLALLLGSLVSDGSEDEDVDVDLDDLDLERIGNMRVSDLISALLEGKDEPESEDGKEKGDDAGEEKGKDEEPDGEEGGEYLATEPQLLGDLPGPRHEGKEVPDIGDDYSMFKRLLDRMKSGL